MQPNVPFQNRELPRLSLVVVGPSDAGKTSLLRSLRFVRTASLHAASLRRYTVDHFCTLRRDYTAIDFPKNVSLKNFLVGVPQEMVLLVVPVGFISDSQAEVCLQLKLLALLGATRLVVAVSKMDLVHFQEHEFVQTKQEIQRMLIAANWAQDFVERRTPFVPISVHHNDNVSSPSTKMPWWESVHIGESPIVTLGDALDSIQLDLVDPAMRHALRETSLFVDLVEELVLAYVGSQTLDLGFRMPLVACLRVRGSGDVMVGCVAQGSIAQYNSVKFALSKGGCDVRWVEMNHKVLPVPLPGDNIGVTFRYTTRDMLPLSGDCLVSQHDPLSKCGSFTARVSVLGASVHKMRVGFVPRCYVGTGSSPCRITAINWKLTSNHMSLQPECVVPGDTAELVFEPLKPLLCDVFTRCPALGRVVVFHGKALLMAGRVEAVVFA